jgi:putative hydrolase of HD superfamily
VDADHTAERLATAVDGDLAARLRFVLEADALKRIDRRSSITGGTRLENSAEHSWHLALMALVLAPYARGSIDVGRVVAMVLVHDLVEIDAGDTFVYDDAARTAKEAAERVAADRLFGMYPRADALRACWEEFEAAETADARFARALDRLQPLLLNHANRGEPWRRHGITADRVRAVNRVIDAASQDLWNAAQSLIDDAVAQGWLTEHAEPEEHA